MLTCLLVYSQTQRCDDKQQQRTGFAQTEHIHREEHVYHNGKEEKEQLFEI